MSREAVVIGRIGADLTPTQLGERLDEATTFVRAVGGFAGNVAIGLARVGVSTSVVTAIGDDPHGQFVRTSLEGEGVDASMVVTKPGSTQVAFYEVRSPDDVRVTFHRSTPAPETLLTATELGDVAGDAKLAVVSAALLASEPARSAVLGLLARRRRQRERGRANRLTLLDLDWRPTLWIDPSDAAPIVRAAIEDSDVVVGSDLEFAASAADPHSIVAGGARVVGLKHGPAGASVLTGAGETRVAPVPVDAVAGVGSGDAFVASFTAGLLRGLAPGDSLRRANAAGAIVASRLLCSAAMPTDAEIDALLSLERETSEVAT